MPSGHSRRSRALSNRHTLSLCRPRAPGARPRRAPTVWLVLCLACPLNRAQQGDFWDDIDPIPAVIPPVLPPVEQSTPQEHLALAQHEIRRSGRRLLGVYVGSFTVADGPAATFLVQPAVQSCVQVCEDLFGDDMYHSYSGSVSADEVTGTCNGDAYGGACRTGATAQPDDYAGTRCERQVWYLAVPRWVPTVYLMLRNDPLS
jgi:hypothetical protein